MDNLDKRMPVLHVHYLQYIFGTIVGQTYQQSKFSINTRKTKLKKVPEYMKSSINIALRNFVNFRIQWEQKAIIAKFDLDIFIAVTKEDQNSVTG